MDSITLPLGQNFFINFDFSEVSAQAFFEGI